MAVNDLDASAADTTVGEIACNGGEAIACVGDITDAARVQAMIEDTARAFGAMTSSLTTRESD